MPFPNNLYAPSPQYEVEFRLPGMFLLYYLIIPAGGGSGGGCAPPKPPVSLPGVVAVTRVRKTYESRRS